MCLTSVPLTYVWAFGFVGCILFYVFIFFGFIFVLLIYCFTFFLFFFYLFIIFFGLLVIFNSISVYFYFLNLFMCFCFLFCFCFFNLYLFFPSVFCLDSYSLFFWEIIKYVFFFLYSMLIGFLREGAGVDTDRFACIFSWQPQCASRVWLTHVPDLPR